MDSYRYRVERLTESRQKGVQKSAEPLAYLSRLKQRQRPNGWSERTLKPEQRRQSRALLDTAVNQPGLRHLPGCDRKQHSEPTSTRQPCRFCKVLARFRVGFGVGLGCQCMFLQAIAPSTPPTRSPQRRKINALLIHPPKNPTKSLQKNMINFSCPGA